MQVDLNQLRSDAQVCANAPFFDGWMDESKRLTLAAPALVAEIERLRAALEPFAKACVKAEANAEQQARLGMGIMTDKASPGWGIQYGHLKAARAALQGQSND